MHTLFQKKYRDYYDERYETDRRHLQEREADMEKEIEEKATQKSFEQLAGKYRTESDPEVNADHEPIEIIQPDDFGGDAAFDINARELHFVRPHEHFGLRTIASAGLFNRHLSKHCFAFFHAAVKEIHMAQKLHHKFIGRMHKPDKTWLLLRST